MKPCLFCGKAGDAEDGDTLYPNGTAWQVLAAVATKQQIDNNTQTCYN